MSERTVRDCDECHEPALLTLRIQDRTYDLCSYQCGFQIMQRDFDKQQKQQKPQKTNVLNMKDARKK